MLFNLFSSITTRKSPANPTTSAQSQAQARPAQLHPAPLGKPSKLRGAFRSVLQVLHLRRSNPKNNELNQDYQVYQTSAIPFQRPSTTTQDNELIVTSAVPLSMAAPSTTANMVALADISPLFAAQHTGSTTTPPAAAADLIAALKEKAELEAAIAKLKHQEAHQARVLEKLEDLVSTGMANFISQRDAAAEARRGAEERLAAEIVRRKRAEKWLLEEQDRCWDVEYEAKKVFHDLEEANKKQGELEKKIVDLQDRSDSDLLAPDLLLEALERLGLVNICDPDRCPLPGSCLPLFLEEVYTRALIRDGGMAGRSAAGYWTSNDSDSED